VPGFASLSGNEVWTPERLLTNPGLQQGPHSIYPDGKSNQAAATNKDLSLFVKAFLLHALRATGSCW
jgi:hypothetical protein